MTAAVLKPVEIVALRHFVYSDLLSMMPIASYDQAMKFVANLRLCRDATPRALDAALMRFLTLRVTPDIAGGTSYKWPTPAEIETYLNRKYGERLRHIAGTRNAECGMRNLNLPRNCAAYGYRTDGARGTVAGILFAPLDRPDTYFLLSSARDGGPRAVPLSPADRKYFENADL